MRHRLRLSLLFVPVLFLLPSSPAQAQRGALIEDLFRTIADAQLEREQRKRIEAERESRKPPLTSGRTQPGGVQPIQVPGTIFPKSHAGNTRPGQIQPPGLNRTKNQSINVRSREAQQFAQSLVSFNGSIDPMLRDMRAGAAQNPTIRGLLPEAYQVAADTRALLQRCDGLSALDPVIQPYSELDTRWRGLSFKLRSIDGLSQQCTTSVRSCDQLVGTMSRQLKIEPQFDRHQLHDLMIVASTQMQALLDDLQLCGSSARDVERMSHDCRLLRQRLLQEADRVEDTSYEDLVTRFTDFAGQWGAYGEQVYALNDPHMQRRLDRIRECGDQTYALLWIPPPYNAATLTASANRLERSCGDVLDQLTFRSMISLSPQDQVRVMESCRRMYGNCQSLTKSTTRGASRNQLRDQFIGIDKDWAFLRSRFFKMNSLNRATLSSIDHECEQIRGAVGIAPSAGQTVGYEELLQVAAALEGSAEYLDADLHRYERYLSPDSYRKSVVEASHELHHHAKELHAALSSRADLTTLQTEAEHLLDGWHQLSQNLNLLESHGLSERRSQGLRRAQQELVPLVAKIAAALVQR